MTDARSVFRPDLFAGTTSIVTGGGSGIGFAIARELATLGSRVLIAGRKADKLAHAAEQIRTQTGAEVHDVVCNIRDEEQVKALMARAVELGMDVTLDRKYFWLAAEALSALESWM